METIYHKLNIKTDNLESVFDAITTAQGVSNWWTKHTTRKDDVYTLVFADDYYKQMKVISELPGRQVTWECIHGDSQWLGTRIAFDLETNNNQGIDVHFRHSKWEEMTELFGLCNYHWALYMKSLKNYIEKGVGQPHRI